MILSAAAPSLSARERKNPPSRKKSCAACIRSKRRCDFALPACLRCSQRGISCDYPARAMRRKVHDWPQPDPAVLLCSEPPLDGLPSAAAAEGYVKSGSSESPSDLLGSHLDDLGSSALTMESLSADLLSFHYDALAGSDSYELIHQPSMLAAPTTKTLYTGLADVITKRLQFALDEMYRAPQTMVSETQTPWCHPLLYARSMPRSMQDAHASCAIYLAKNRVNAPVIFRSIEARIDDLLAQPIAVTPMDSLAHTQSLILYLIILLFDGEISARAFGERLVPVLESSVIDLLSDVNFDIANTRVDALSKRSATSTREFWEDWIFQESARRTILFAYFLLQAYHCLIGTHNLHQCDGRQGLCRFLTLSVHLWTARSAVAFERAWREENHCLMIVGDFGELLDRARAQDVDTFGKILLSSAMGIEEAEAWFAARGGSLTVSATA